jgi:four helix bundle protein
MKNIRSFEDLEAWQKARKLVQEVYTITGGYPHQEARVLVPQTRRSITSVAANIAEGFGRYHFQEARQYFRMARGSLMETKSHLYLALDQGYLDEVIFRDLAEKIETLARFINGLIRSTGNKISQQ